MRDLRPTLIYWMETEVHVYAFSIAACVLLSLFPFLIVSLSLAKYVLGWNGVAAVGTVLDAYFPGDLGNHQTMAGFLFDNLNAAVRSRGGLQVFSLLLLVFTANGIFEPLEVAFNRVWGLPRNRSYFKNQLVSLGLIFVCGSLVLGSIMLSGAGVAAFQVAAVPMSILALWVIYWWLPNGKIPPLAVLPAAAVVGIALELLKYLNLLTAPLWYKKVHAEYGPFIYSVTILLWSFLGAMLILAGAEWAARCARRPPAPILVLTAIPPEKASGLPRCQETPSQPAAKS